MNYCPKCGNELNKGDLYCSNCGTKTSDLNLLVKDNKESKEIIKSNNLAVSGFILSIPALIFSLSTLPIFCIQEVEFRFFDYSVLLSGVFVGLALGFSIRGFIVGIKRRIHKKIGLAGVIISGIAFVFLALVIFFVLLCFGGAFK